MTIYARYIDSSDRCYGPASRSTKHPRVKRVCHEHSYYGTPTAHLSLRLDKKNAAEGTGPQIPCTRRNGNCSHGSGPGYDLSLHGHICELSGRKSAARFASIPGETLRGKFLPPRG